MATYRENSSSPPPKHGNWCVRLFLELAPVRMFIDGDVLARDGGRTWPKLEVDEFTASRSTHDGIRRDA